MDKRVRQMRLGKQINFLNRLEVLIHKDLIPELVQDCNISTDLETTVRLADLLNDTSNFLKETVCRQARIELELVEINEKLDKLINKTE